MGWFLTRRQELTRCRGISTLNTAHGIDISHYNTNLQFHELKESGISFVVVKATQSSQYVDPCFMDYYARVKKVGLLRSAYHFFNPDVDPILQADFFCQTVPYEDGDLRLALDVEVDGPNVSAHAAQCVERIKANTGYYPFLYSGVAFYAANLSGITSCPLWLAEYAVGSPRVTQPPTIWQYTDSGVWGGSGSPVDSNLFYGTVDELRTNHSMCCEASN